MFPVLSSKFSVRSLQFSEARRELEAEDPAIARDDGSDPLEGAFAALVVDYAAWAGVAAVACGMFFLALRFGGATIEWLKAGGWNQ